VQVYSSVAKGLPSILVAGVDIGSTTAKAVVFFNGKLICGQIIPTGTDPVSAGIKALETALNDAHHHTSDLKYTIATGYGRVSASFADKIVTEITCHGRGAYFISPEIRTVIDIGGQDAKVISLGNDGRVIDFVMNDKCASGTGRFLESAAQLVLNLPLEELGRLSSMACSNRDCIFVSSWREQGEHYCWLAQFNSK